MPADGAVLEGRFRVGPPLSSGANGSVYLGEDLESGREVAIKFHHTEYLTDENVRRKFLHAAAGVALIAHPTLVPIYAAGNDASTTFLVMGRVRGETLGARLAARGRVSLDEAIRFGSDALDALAVLHAHGLLHRDVKPSNLVVGPDGHAVLLDLGMLQAADELLSAKGIVEGTPEYMSPEQCRDVRLTDARSDLYSLGATIYAALAGRPPFIGGKPNDIFHKHHVEKPVRPTRIVKSLPPAFDDFVEKALAKKPAKRFQNASEMNAALVALQPRDGVSRTSTPNKL